MNTRIDLLVADPYPVFNWMEENVKSAIVRKIAYLHPYLDKWHLKIVLDTPEAVDNFKLEFKEYIVENVIVTKENFVNKS